MDAFLLYLGRSGLYLSLFYAFFLLVMRRTTFFRFNRITLLAGSYLCLLLPFIRLRNAAAGSAEGGLLTLMAGNAPVEAVMPRQAFPWMEVVLALYAAGVLVTLGLLLRSAWKMDRTIRSGDPLQQKGYRLVLLDSDIPSFTWMRTIVMGRKDFREHPTILTHETMHVRFRHSLDLLLFAPFQVLHWWNPLVWIMRTELQLLHEFQADEGVIQKGIDATQYQLLLVRKAVGEQRFSMASGFLHAKLKNRITMMLKPSSSPLLRLSYLALVPILAAFMFACNPARSTESVEPAPVTDQPHTKADALDKENVPLQLAVEKPTFNGGDSNEFAKWVNSQLKYPPEALAEKIQGRVLLQFTIDVDGAVRNVSVLKGAHEALDAEALRVISASPRWTPGKNENGELVPVTVRFPVIYQIR